MAAGLWLAAVARLQSPAPEAGAGGAVASLLHPIRKQHGPGAGEDQLGYLAVGADDAHRGGLGGDGCRDG
jgi:hypothetical protein